MASTSKMWRSIANIHSLRSLSVKITPGMRCWYATGTGSSLSRPELDTSTGKAEVISKAMKAYLERARAYENYMKKEVAEFEMGRQHLARIMGVEPEDFTQEDINSAIRYLLPSGLFDKKSRPMLKHPDKVVPKRAGAQFGADGRPFQSMFYTSYPSFYDLVHNLAQTYEALKVQEVKLKLSRLAPPEKFETVGSEWISQQTLTERLNEEITLRQYNQCIHILERIADHPLASRYDETLMSYRVVLTHHTQNEQIPEPKETESGRLYIFAEGGRKTAKAHVDMWEPGDGHITINGQDVLTTFPNIIDREQVLFPLQFTQKLGKVDIEATVSIENITKSYYGHSAMAGALRLALARALRSFVSKDMLEKLRLSGLLTRDPRMRERKKPGQEGARRKYTWKKR